MPIPPLAMRPTDATSRCAAGCSRDHDGWARRSAVALVLALSAFVGLTASCGETIDNFNSEASCKDYCAKSFDCNNQSPTSGETDTCVGNCRNAIEDNCGNDNQAAANDKINECVDKGCVEFWGCMVFDTAPECFGFVNH